jgi:hypothetical protein
MIMVVPNMNSEKTSTELKNSTLKKCLYDFCFSQLGTTAASIRDHYLKETKVVITKTTFSRHLNTTLPLENHGLLSLQDIRNNDIVPILAKNCVGGL